jgi:hypothetical protein
MAEFIISSSLTPEKKTLLCAIYSPYLIIPATILLYMLVNEKPFDGNLLKKKK